MAPTFYLEAQLKPECEESLGEANDKLQDVFSDGLIEHLKLNHDLCASEIYAPCFPPYVDSIKVVHFTASNDVTIFHETKDCRIVINSYKMRDDNEIDLDDDLSSTHPRLLPTAELEESWESLEFDSDIKESLVQLAANSLRLKALGRLILLTGPPGTGKSTLARALAQRLSIRLNREFSDTFLLHLHAAALLSQYFGQSAKEIHKIFESIADLSSENPSKFYVLVIDEIESLAGSRSRATAQNEVQDGIRATNQLLVGFDTIRNRRNVLIICTSNLLDSLDKAFIDRCSKMIVVPPPGAPARYAILRYGLQSLVEDEIIQISEYDSLPSYEDAVLGLESDIGSAGLRLRELVDSMDTSNNDDAVSARWLGQLPGVSLGTYLDAEASCTLDEAVDMMRRYVESLGMFSVKAMAMSAPRSPKENGKETSPSKNEKRELDERITDTTGSKRPRVEHPAPIEEVKKQLDLVVDRVENVEKNLTRLNNLLLGHTVMPPSVNGQEESAQEEMATTTGVHTLGWAPNLETSVDHKEEVARRPLQDIGQGSDRMLLDESSHATVEKKKHRVGSLVDKLDSLLGSVGEHNGVH